MGNQNGKGGEEKTDTTMWMVTFGDLLMLLLTFFVMLLTMSSMDTKALRASFSVFEGGLGVLDFADINKIEALEEKADLAGLKGTALSVVGDLNNKLNELLSSRRAIDVTGKGVLEQVFGGGDDSDGGAMLSDLGNIVEISEDERGVVLTIKAELLFDSGTAEIRKEMVPLVDSMAALTKAVSNDVLVMGHTDNTPVRDGEYRSNWELSLYRALNIYDYFINDKKISPERVFAGGYGDLRPRFSNETVEGRRRNRRVELILRETS
jgi:chemotaxis protein MotB